MRHDSAVSGREALAMLLREAAAGDPYTLAILDMQMPEMDGLQLAQAIKAAPATASVRLLMMTSLGHHGDDRPLEEAGLMTFLTKPVKQSQLFDHLALIIGDDAQAIDRFPNADAEKLAPQMYTAPTVIPAKVVESMDTPTRILVAEDNL